jgi:hypothetical protein
LNPNARVSVSADGVLTFLTKIVDFVTGIFKPVLHFIITVSGSGWVGFAAIFMIFFTLHLLRFSSRSGNHEVYSSGLEYIALRGLLISGGYVVLMLIEYLFMPPLVILATALFNTVTGSEPGIGALVGFLLGESPQRDAFLADVGTFYGTPHLLLPLDFRSVGLIVVAFGSMYLVAKGIQRARGVAAE